MAYCLDYLIFDLCKLPQEEITGALNYCICKLLTEVIDPTRYNDYNTIMGILESAKQEIYRRLISHYEDKKKEENGDVFNV